MSIPNSLDIQINGRQSDVGLGMGTGATSSSPKGGAATNNNHWMETTSGSQAVITTKEKSTRLHDSKFILLCTWIRISSLLVEDLMSIFLQPNSSDEATRRVYFIMYGFSVASGVVEAIGLANFGIEICGMCTLEAAQAILFMWTCKFSYQSILVFGVIGVTQLVVELIEACYALTHEEDEGAMSDEEKTKLGARMCMKCYLPIIVGGCIIPYLYYNDDSFFRAQWFNICMAISFWMSSIQQDIQGRLIGQVALEDTQKITVACDSSIPWYYRLMFLVNYFWGLGFSILIYVLSIEFIIGKKWENDFEKGYTIFIVASMSCLVCSLCCQILAAFTPKQ